MIGTLLGIIVGIGVIAQAFNGELQVWSLAAVVVVVLIGFIFPVTVGTFLTGVAIASPIAAILGFIFGNTSSGLAALGIGVLAFGGQFVIGMVRRDSSELGPY
jgi:hypothetical protein